MSDYDDHPPPEPPPEWLQLRKLFPQPSPQPAARPPGSDQPAFDPGPLDHPEALQKYLKLLDGAIEWCFDADRYDRCAASAIGARLIKASIDAAAAMKQAPERQFTYRMVVERVAPPLPPAPHQENLKTIHGVARPVEPQDVGTQPNETSAVETHETPTPNQTEPPCRAAHPRATPTR